MMNQRKIIEVLLLVCLVMIAIYAIFQSGATSTVREYYCENIKEPVKSIEDNANEDFERVLNSASPALEKCDPDINNKSIVLVKRLRDLKLFIDGAIRRIKEENVSNEFLAAESEISQLQDLIISDVLKMDESNEKNLYRKNELTKITNTIQERILQIQFPADCKKAKKIRCFIPRDCGFGCQFHTFAGCLIDGYSKKRVVILQNWNFQIEWEEIFQPITNCTLKDISDPSSNFSQGMDKIEVVNDSVIFADIRINLPSTPFAFPAEFAPTLLKMHPDPPAFWIGQFMHYLMRYQPDLQKHVEETMQNLTFNTDEPIAGLHVRRTNKINSEAELFHINEYMDHVESWFKTQSAKRGKPVKKRLLLTTEDAAVIDETLVSYPDYEVLYDKEGITQANANRWSGKGVYGIVTSLHMLTRCNFVVCTHSSNMCRFAYELMQITRMGEITTNVVSLDTVHYWYGQLVRQDIARMEHRPVLGVIARNGINEIELNVGDIINIDTPIIGINRRNFFDGFSYGTNLRTGKRGKYPSYKIEENWRIVNF